MTRIDTSCTVGDTSPKVEVQHMIDRYPSLHQTVRVDEFGVVTHGMAVPPMSTSRSVAVASHVVHALRFAPNLMPAGVDMSTSAPHDCNNHLREFESATDVAARDWYNRPDEVAAA